MTKYSGHVGFVEGQVETSPGVYEDKVVEHNMRGDVIQASVSMQDPTQIHDDLQINNQLLILGDQYSYENFMHIRYAFYMGARWKVTNVTLKRPRLQLQLGGVWNGQTSASQETKGSDT